MRSQSDVIRTESLGKCYHSLKSRSVALRGLDLEVASGEIFGYLGPNGAGKTTTLRLLMGLVRPTAGRAWIQGTPVADPGSRRSVGFMAEQPGFPGHLSGMEFLRMCGRLSGLDRAEAHRRACALLEKTRMEDVAHRRVRHLSKGMLQWLGLAQALIGNPRLLILDEPMSGLDPVGRRAMRDLILEERNGGTTVFFSSHILADVELICDRVGILLGGDLVHCGRLDEILDRRSEDVEIRVTGLPPALAERIRGLGARTRTFGEETLIEARGSEPVDRILDWIRESGARVRSLVPRRETLEDFFLRQVAGSEVRGCGFRAAGADIGGPDPGDPSGEKPVRETVEAGASARGEA